MSEDTYCQSMAKYLQNLAELYQRTGAWAKNYTPEEAKTLFDELAVGILGSEIEARKFLKSIPEANHIVAMLPKRLRGRKDAIRQMYREKALYMLHQIRVDMGKKHVIRTAEYVHKKFGIGKTQNGALRTLQRVIKKYDK